MCSPEARVCPNTFTKERKKVPLNKKNQECSCMTQYQLSFWLVSWDWFSFHTLLAQVGVRSVILRLLSSIIWLFVNTQSAGDFNSFCLANTLSIFYGCGVLKINCHTYNSPPELENQLNQCALNQQNQSHLIKTCGGLFLWNRIWYLAGLSQLDS